MSRTCIIIPHNSTVPVPKPSLRKLPLDHYVHIIERWWKGVYPWRGGRVDVEGLGRQGGVYISSVGARISTRFVHWTVGRFYAVFKQFCWEKRVVSQLAKAAQNQLSLRAQGLGNSVLTVVLTAFWCRFDASFANRERPYSRRGITPYLLWASI